MDYHGGYVIVGGETRDHGIMVLGATVSTLYKPLIAKYSVTAASSRVWAKWINLSSRSLYNVAFSPDGLKIIAHLDQNYILIIDASNGAILLTR